MEEFFLVGEVYPYILVFIAVFYSTWLYHMYTIIHACILFLILVFYVVAQYEMLVFCNPLSKCPSATPFLFLLAGTQYYFFYGQDETISLCICGYCEYIVFYGDNNCDLISWYGDSYSFTEKNNKINGRFIVNIMFFGTRK